MYTYVHIDAQIVVEQSDVMQSEVLQLGVSDI